MSPILLIAKREIITRVRSVWFWVATIAIPLFIVIISLAPIILQLFNDNGDKKIAVVDESKIYINQLKDSDLKFVYIQYKSLENLKTEYKDLGYTAILSIPDKDLDKSNNITVFSDKNLSSTNSEYINTELNRVLKENKLKKLNLTNEQLVSLNNSVSAKTVLLNNGQETGSNSSTVAYILAFGLGFVMYFVIFLFGTMIMTSVLEEKNNRVVEILISSIKVFDLMAGKIFGLAVVVMIQIATWLILLSGFSVAFSLFLNSGLNFQSSPVESASISSVNYSEIISGLSQLNLPLIIFLCIFYFIFGYLIYAAWFAALGASVESSQDANNSGLAWIIYTPLVITIIFISNIIESPQSELAIFLSLFPLSSPVAMLARIPFGVPWWQILLSILFLIFGFIGSIWVAAKIYKIGILTYGKKASLKDIVKWIRY